MQDLTIFVNTSDNFEDCWIPFFTLFHRYWPDCRYPIVLNTETKDFQFAGLSIHCSKVAAGETRRLTWSECLARSLDAIETPYILYLQEDYFLENPVKTGQIELLLAEMRAGRADVIRIMECGGAGPWRPTLNPLLWEVDQHSQYRISLQAGLWRKSTLRGQIRLHESPWQLEVFGSARARRKQEKVLCVNRDLFSSPEAEILPYQPTGVVAGRWEREIVEPLFAKEGLAVDFSIRGFHDRNAKRPNKRPLFNRIYDRLRSLL
ncbi:MAG: hypothetical protein PHW13_01985 [Methylococcales bacterium]|nr:hypothetical protein [Methylococcales bacterium]